MVWNKSETKETNESLLNASNKMKLNIEDNPEKWADFLGFHSLSAKSCKWGTYKNFYCDSSWELAFLVYCLDHDLNILRNTKGFKYIFNNEKHLYYPDFIVDGIYYEIKGIYSEADYEKIKLFSKELVVIDKDNINKYLNYATNKYGKNFTKILYDKDRPNYINLPNKINKS